LLQGMNTSKDCSTKAFCLVSFADSVFAFLENVLFVYWEHWCYSMDILLKFLKISPPCALNFEIVYSWY